ncbi:MAG TPA: 4-(cytidine 5'-diphospho)-2-C-methyl-D-erythritol kinase [Vicinamibacterales bacterium]
MTTPVTIRAHAKINLDLRVLGMRPDGFHELRTVFQAIALHDTITCIPREGPFTLECGAAGVPLDRSNLVWRAGEALWRALRRAGPLRDMAVRVEKRIPVQAGLGGGSANAAAALMALARAWRVPVKPAQLTDVAATLGADVPFFLSGGTALGLGRGDEIYPLADLPRHWIVLLVPGFGVSSGDAYRWYDEERDPGRGHALREPQYVPGPWPSRAAQMINDLEVAIARHHPEIDQMKSALRRSGALAAAMSGSGSAVFGLYQKRRDATAAVERLSGSGWRVVLTESLNRDAYAKRSRPLLARHSGLPIAASLVYT